MVTSTPQNEKYELLKKQIDDRVYSRTDLYDLIYRFFPNYSVESCNWVIGRLVQEGFIRKLGKGYFKRPKEFYVFQEPPKYRNEIRSLSSFMGESDLALIPGVEINKLTGEGHDYDFLLVEVPKNVLFPCYMDLRSKTKKEILLNPSPEEFLFRYRPGCIVLRTLFSKSPCLSTSFFSVEKLIVDLLADHFIRTLYSGADFEESAQELLKSNNVNLSVLINYGKRRKVDAEILGLAATACPLEAKYVLGGD